MAGEPLMHYPNEVEAMPPSYKIDTAKSEQPPPTNQNKRSEVNNSKNEDRVLD